MSQQQGVSANDITFKASGDLSSNQFYFMSLDADGKVEACGANGRAIGILQNKPDAEDKAARVRIGGTSKLKMNEECDVGVGITSTSAGLGEVVDDEDEFFIAIALEEATAQNDIIEVKLIGGAYAADSHAD